MAARHGYTALARGFLQFNELYGAIGSAPPAL